MTKLESANTTKSNNEMMVAASEIELNSILKQVTENVSALEKYNNFLESNNNEPKDMLGARFINFHATFSQLMANQQALEKIYPDISDTENNQLSDQAKAVHEQLLSAVNLGLNILQQIDVSTYSLKNQMDTIKDVINDDT
ncbi:hypothetical protein JQC92_00560 [Shewanella sp. 202IG2-18]|uniref:hypothetical protein n=1 Tax=Parashewanella hymeniacidonis TaxID=2807618 RepID=UPI0019607E9B|nr:hypothetical protein [Parashewanella hymeniacidonis]MBM7070537.1 hypothetical protein [Parashewanella hymeniacidonis]